jgi:hypothetical protein
MDHLPEDELYDATPAPEDREEQAATEEQQRTKKPDPPQKSAAKGKTTKSSKKVKDSIKILEDEVGPIKEEASSFPPERTTTRRQKPAKNVEQVQESPRPATGTPKSAEAKGSGTRRGKQRAKPPITFDEETNEIIEPPHKAADEPVHMSMVENMKRAYATSVSPDANTKKPTPKSRKKAAPKGVSKSSPKAGIKATSKPAPKAATKTSPIVAQRTTRQSTSRGQLNQQTPDKVEQANTSVSPAAPPLESEANPPPAVDQRTTRTKAKGKTTSTLQPSKDQERPEPGNDTQGSTDYPIVLSSGPESSLLSDDDEFVPATDPTEVSPTETARADTAPRAKRQSLVDPIVDPEEPLSVARNKQGRIVAPQPEIPKTMHPVRRTERQVTAQKKTIAVKADPKNLVEAPLQRTNREQPIRIGPREVLSARDANALAQRNAPKTNPLKRPASTRDPVVDTSVPPRKVSKLSRSFSVSQAGSPLPLESVAAQSIEGKSPSDRDSVEHPKAPHGNKQTSGNRRSQRLRSLAD